MTHRFDDAIVAGVLAHMNGDHGGDNLLIAQAFGATPDVHAATMTAVDGDGGEWTAEVPGGGEVVVRVPWPSGSISERPEIRREIVALYDAACERLGITPRPHA